MQQQYEQPATGEPARASTPAAQPQASSTAEPEIVIEAFRETEQGSHYRVSVDFHSKIIYIPPGAITPYRADSTSPSGDSGDSGSRSLNSSAISQCSEGLTFDSTDLVSFSCNPDSKADVYLPPGDWTHGEVQPCPNSKKPKLVLTTTLDDWPVCRTVWHDVTISQSELKFVMLLRTNVHIVMCMRYPGVNLIYKTARFPHEMPLIHHESCVYELITKARRPGPNQNWFAPQFMGHVKQQDGQVRGFVLEYIHG